LIEYTQVIIREADRLQTLVDRLLEPHRKPHLVSSVNIHEVCERVRSLVLAEFPQGLRVIRDYDTSLPEFRGDLEQLIQTILNIVHNAAQALAERIQAGDAQITLRTRVARQVTFGKHWNCMSSTTGLAFPRPCKTGCFCRWSQGVRGGQGWDCIWLRPLCVSTRA